MSRIVKVLCSLIPSYAEVLGPVFSGNPGKFLSRLIRNRCAWIGIRTKETLAFVKECLQKVTEYGTQQEPLIRTCCPAKNRCISAGSVFYFIIDYDPKAQGPALLNQFCNAFCKNVPVYIFQVW